jgi:hypothetical protein
MTSPIIYYKGSANSFLARSCGLCGAWVVNTNTHTAWHLKNDPAAARTQEPIPTAQPPDHVIDRK